ncbi:MAG: PhoH family protein [Thiotrichales bacterium]|nr:PhoH family protein [Thiotrichales bacterium]
MQDREIEAHTSLPAPAESDARPGAGGGRASDGTGRLPGACVQDATSRLFVLDTNVLMHDPTALFRFDEHDMYLPMVVLEELDAAKQGASEGARNVREVGRILDEIVRDADEAAIGCGIPLPGPERTTGNGRLFLQTRAHAGHLPETLPGSKPDNGILNVATALRREQPERGVVIVSKDINLRIKARALGLHAEDYRDDVVLDDVSLLYPGVHRMPDAHWEERIGAADSRVEDGRTLYAVDAAADEWFPNQCLYPGGAAGAGLVVRRIESDRALLEPARDYRAGGDTVWGVSARNVEQNFALNLLVDPDIDFVTLIGTAGTGKTLLALAAGLAQTLDDKRYREIVVTRVTVPVADDIGFLPGTEEEKMTPWMGALMDNLEVLTDLESDGGGWGRAATDDLLLSRIKVRSLNFMRGRTFLNRYVILDEAQNLTRHQMKTLITRAGPGTKLVCLGNVRQIDTPWLSETTSGLTHVVDRFKRWPHSGHVTLVRGERSRLADFATESL